MRVLAGIGMAGLMTFGLASVVAADEVSDLKAQMLQMQEQMRQMQDEIRSLKTEKVARAPARVAAVGTDVEERLEALEETVVEQAVEREQQFKIGAWSEILFEDVINGPNPSSTFDIRNVNVFLEAPIADQFRFYTELELRGDTNTQTARDIGIQDDMEFNLERAWIDWNYSEQVNVRLGKFLTPYGIWNIDHFATKRVTTRDPFLIRREIIPETLTGLRYYGSVVPLEGVTVNYTGWLANGKGTNPDSQDQDTNKAYGGRVGVTFPVLEYGELTLGVTGYSGEDPSNSVDEEIFGLDAEYYVGPFRYIFELASANLEDSTGLVFGDSAWYNQLEFQLAGLEAVGLDVGDDGAGHWQKTTLFVRHDVNRRDFDDSRATLGIPIFDQDGWVITTGLNYRLRENIVLKGEWHWHDLRKGGPDHEMLIGSVAMAY